MHQHLPIEILERACDALRYGGPRLHPEWFGTCSPMWLGLDWFCCSVATEAAEGKGSGLEDFSGDVF